MATAPCILGLDAVEGVATSKEIKLETMVKGRVWPHTMRKTAEVERATSRSRARSGTHLSVVDGVDLVPVAVPERSQVCKSMI